MNYTIIYAIILLVEGIRIEEVYYFYRFFEGLFTSQNATGLKGLAHQKKRYEAVLFINYTSVLLEMLLCFYL